MSHVVFNPDQEDQSNHFRQSYPRGLAGWLIKVSGGLVKTESVANLILVIIAIVCFAFSIIILWLTF